MVVRHGVFETNSSSTHSICVAFGGVRRDRLYPDDRGLITVWPGEFGWEVESYYDAATKLSYLYTYISNYLSDEACPSAIDRLTRLIQLQCGEHPVVYEQFDSYYPNGYIDHQSLDVPASVWNENDEYVLQFLFNGQSELKTDNDNH